MPKIQKILIANRGEIALRILRACRDLNIKTVSIYSEADCKALHVLQAEEAYCVGPASVAQSYLNTDKIISIALQAKADAIHPGYGFLSENPEFAEKVQKAGLIFIGPSAEIIRAMGCKIEARKIAQAAQVPIVPGIESSLQNFAEAEKMAEAIGYPILLKASAGGGGKGMRTVRQPKDLKSAFELASAEALSAFGNNSLYLEKLIENPHHIEIQVFGDSHGNILHLYERECSIQRRHQKVIEESPSPFITQKTREALCDVSIKLCRALGYTNAGTLEFLVDADQNFYFLEMNTRLQVEHPITEQVTGIDCVKLQIQIAQGDAISFQQEEIQQKGHSIECRIYAEDPFQNFFPSPQKILYQRLPEGPGIRIDNGVYAGYEIPMEYDPMLAKLISYGQNREEALNRMQRALLEYVISGPKTNLYFHLQTLTSREFIEGKYDTHFIEKNISEILKISPEEKENALIAVTLAKFLEESIPKKISEETSETQTSSEVSAWRLQGRLEMLRG